MEILSPLFVWLGDALAAAQHVLVNLGIKGSVLLLLAFLTAMGLRSASAAARHLVWTAALAGLVALPLVSVAAPEWRLPAVPGLDKVWNGMPDVDPPPEVAPAPTTARSRSPEATSTVPPAPATRSARADAAPEMEIPPPFVFPARGDQEALESGQEALRWPPVPATGAGSLGWGAWGVIAWLVGLTLVLLWSAAGHLDTWWIARSARRVTQGRSHQLLRHLCRELGITAPVALLEGDPDTMPRTWGLSPSVLLPSGARKWSDDKLRAVLLHELAHVKRRDWLLQVVAQAAEALYWFNPLVWYAAHRMRIERERACDDLVLVHGSRATDYATHLLDIARSMRAGPFTPSAGLAVARKSQLRSRLMDILDATRRRAAVSPGLAAAVWLTTALVVIPMAGAASATNQPPAETVGESWSGPVAPASSTGFTVFPEASEAPTAPGAGFSQPWVEAPDRTGPRNPSTQVPQCDWNRRGADVSTSMNVNDDQMELRIQMDDCRLTIEARGDVEFNPREIDVVSISRGGYFEIEESEAANTRRLELRPAGDGGVERRWLVDGKGQEYDQGAREWFAELLPVLFRRAGYQAEERAVRILDQQGVSGLQQEIAMIPSDYVARKYYEVLLIQGDLSEAQLRDAVRQAGQDLESDYELAELLIEVAEEHPADESVQIAYVEAAGSIESDYETRRVLDAALARSGLSQEVAQAMLELATGIDSDYELAELLLAMLERHPVEETLTPQFFAVVETIDSDYERARVLKAALDRGAPSQAVLDLALESASQIDSDYELAELLLYVGERYPTDRSLPDAFLRRASSIESDYERGRVLSVLIEQGPMGSASLAQVLGLSAGMSSDYELAELLIKLAENQRLDEELRARYVEVAEGMSSEYERDRALAALVRSQGGFVFAP
jgi:beta-lactamase regulating signal transducer with metallopeptidase domain